jgi:P4 family phage/plasmid primase-like protien
MSNYPSEPDGHRGADFIVDVFGSSTAHPVFICSLPNSGQHDGQLGERFVTTRCVEDIAGFARKWDRPRRALYYAVNTVKPNARRRSKQTISEINALHADIDFKELVEGPDEARRILRQLRHLPSVVNFTGHGLPVLWLFKEAIEATDESIAEVEALLRLLADHVGADPSAAEIARLLRLPGSHNSKGGEWTEVITETATGCRYELDDLREWLEIAGPVLHRKPKANGAGEPEANPFLELAKRQGFHVPVDAEARLRDMSYQGPGANGIHATQLSVTASLLSHGEPVSEVIAIVMAATRAAAGHFGDHWNWRREERAIRSMCESWLAKHPTATTAAAEPAAAPELGPASAPPSDGPQGDAGATDGSASEPQPGGSPQPGSAGKRKKRRTPGAATLVTVIVDGVIAQVRKVGCDLLLADGDLHIYRDGVWRPLSPGDQQWLRVSIQGGAKALGEGGQLRTVNAAWRLLNEHPGLYHDDVAWDPPGLAALANGTLDLLTRDFGPWRPEHFLRRKLAVGYDPQAAAPHFLVFMQTLFADRPAAECAPLIELVQEFFGAALAVRLLTREQRRALILVGASRTGKTELARVIARFVGEPIASPAASEIAERFGLESFYGAQAWIRDDAVNEGDRLDPQKFKTIVTGESIGIERKNRTAIRVELEIPVVLTCNSLPASRDASDAVFNRSLVVDLGHVIDEAAAIANRQALGMPTGLKLGHWLADREGPGILNWALTGLARLLKKGEFTIPAPVASSIRRFKDESNAVSEFARTMLKGATDIKVERKDILCAFQGWLKEEAGDDARLHGARWLIPKLRNACPWSIARKIMGTHYFCGMELTAEGLDFWSEQSDSAHRSGRGCKGSSTRQTEVNKPWKPLLEKGDDDQ